VENSTHPVLLAFLELLVSGFFFNVSENRSLLSCRRDFPKYFQQLVRIIPTQSSQYLHMEGVGLPQLFARVTTKSQIDLELCSVRAITLRFTSPTKARSPAETGLTVRRRENGTKKKRPAQNSRAQSISFCNLTAIATRPSIA
jgi:hypothetical protein